MSVSDLTNTTWVFKNDIDVTVEGGEYNITFTSNNTNYTVIRYGEIGNYRLYYDSTSVYRSDWYNDNYKTIEITGGTDATNSSLISWLESNATLQESGGGDTPTSTGKIGDLPIIKKHFGDLEIIKEVLNGETIYSNGETPTPPTPPTPTYPSKSDIITMNIDGTNRKFRVLKNVSGSIFEVLGMFTLQAQFNTSGESTAFKNSNLDTYLNTTWYGTLNATAKDAIVTGTYEQRDYTVSSSSTSVNTTYDKEWYYYKNDVSSTPSYVWCRPQSHTASSSRFSGDFTSKIYTLTAYKIIEYLNPQNTIKNDYTPFKATNVYKMVSGYTNAIYVTLADAEYTNRLGQITSSGSLGYASFGYTTVTTNNNWYPLFQIDLSKITFTINS